MQYWVYSERLASTLKCHVVSEAEQTRLVDFWWDLRVFDDHEVRLAGAAGTAVARLRVFQERQQCRPSKPTVWAYIEYQAHGEERATMDGAAHTRDYSSYLTFLTGVPFRPSGDAKLVRLDVTEYGWIPHFDKEEFKGVDLLQGLPIPASEDASESEIPAVRRVPLHEPIIGFVLSEKNLDIGFTDTLRDHDRNVKVSVQGLHLAESEVKSALASTPDSLPTPSLILTSALYAGAMAQDEPANQFVLLWAIVETLVNSIAGEPMLSDEKIGVALNAIGGDKTMQSRLAGALRQVTIDGFRVRVRRAFNQAFGVCREGTDKSIADLRSLRGKLLHPRTNSPSWESELVRGLSVLRELIEAHLSDARAAYVES